MDIRRVLVIIPVRDEADALRWLLPRLKEAAATLGTPCDLLVIDDGSSDDSSNAAAAANIPVIRQDPSGKPRAVQRGFACAMENGYDAALVFDGDAQHPVEILTTMVESLRTYAIVKGTRFHAASPQVGTPADRIILNRKIRERLKTITGWPVSDPQCGLIGLHGIIIRMILPRLRWHEEWEIEFLLHLHQAMPGQPYPIYEIPIPAVYTGLPGAKQREKYHKQHALVRLRERLSRQMRVIGETLRALQAETK